MRKLKNLVKVVAAGVLAAGILAGAVGVHAAAPNDAPAQARTASVYDTGWD